jgi:hypothetical protein
VKLRDVEPDDLGLYVRMRRDPVMMAELGGPLPREGSTNDELRSDCGRQPGGRPAVS